MQNIFVGLDIGSFIIKAVVAEVGRDGRIKILRFFKVPSDGMRKGMVDDLPAATRALGIIFSDIKQYHKDAIKNIYLCIGSPNVRLQGSRGIVAVSRADLEIYKDDIIRVKEAAESIKLSANRMVIHSLTDEFSVDDISDIKDPLGMVGNRLEARSLIIDAFAPAVRNLIRCVEIAGGGIAGLIFNPLASAKATLSKNQKDLGVALLDIGFGTTSIAVYQDGKLLHTGSFHAGSGHITNDLAIGLKISIPAAESIKFSFGSALAKDVPLRETVELAKFDSNSRGGTSRRFISEIIEVRLAEIMEVVHNDLRNIGKAGQLPAGLVLVGGGAKLPSLTYLVNQELRLPARIGVPDLSQFEIESPDLVAALEDPECACVLGLVSMGAERMLGGKSSGVDLGGWFRKIVNYFMP